MLKLSRLFIIGTVLFVSCKTQKHITNAKDKYIMAYKKAVLYGCLNEATNGEFQKFSINNNDLGLAVEVSIIYHSDVLFAVNNGKELSKNIRTIDYSDYQGKKPIFSNCVDFAFSKSVDSIARLKYKNLKKSKLEYKNE